MFVKPSRRLWRRRHENNPVFISFPHEHLAFIKKTSSICDWSPSPAHCIGVDKHEFKRKISGRRRRFIFKYLSFSRLNASKHRSFDGLRKQLWISYKKRKQIVEWRSNCGPSLLRALVSWDLPLASEANNSKFARLTLHIFFFFALIDLHHCFFALENEATMNERSFARDDDGWVSFYSAFSLLFAS